MIFRCKNAYTIPYIKLHKHILNVNLKSWNLLAKTNETKSNLSQVNCLLVHTSLNIPNEWFFQFPYSKAKYCTQHNPWKVTVLFVSLSLPYLCFTKRKVWTSSTTKSRWSLKEWGYNNYWPFFIYHNTFLSFFRYWKNIFTNTELTHLPLNNYCKTLKRSFTKDPV